MANSCTGRDSTDIDIYRFELDSPGEVSIETIAERLTDTSLLDTQLRLYRADGTGAFVEIAQNNDYFSNDSLIRIPDLTPGTYMLGVSARGNNDYDPNIPGSGFGGLTEGEYELRIDFTPTAATSLNDTSSPPQGLDGDSDGRRGGTFNYWFEPADPSNTIFVDKAAVGDPFAARGSVSNPFLEIDQALLAARPGDTVRVVGNGGVDGRLETPQDNFSYQIGRASNGLPLADGESLQIPQGVNLQLEAGAILKMDGERIGVGSIAPTIDRSDASLQVLGTPSIVLDNGLPARDATNAIIPGSVFITSINDASVGRGNQFDLPTAASAGDWGGIDFRGDLDAADETRRNLENEGIFLNHIQFADIRFGGGVVRVGGQNVAVSPIDMATTRATVINSSISNSADAAIAATPDTFREDRFTSPFYQGAGSFTPDYDRVGPEIHGNTVVDNTINGLFVRLQTRSGSTLETVNTNIRFDDTDIPHIITENLVISGTPGGALIQAGAPSSLIIQTAELPGSGDVPAGTYVYRIANVDSQNIESAASDPTLPITTTATGGIQLSQLPTAPVGGDLVARRLYRATVDPVTNEPGPFTLVAQLNASSTSFIDQAATGGAELIETDSPLRARLDSSLVIDPGTVVKIDGARIETRFGANFIAEGTSSNPVILTSLEDQRYGGGGTFDTNNRGNVVGLTPGDWGGLYIGNGSSASIDNAVIAGAGGTTRIEGGFASFNAIEVHQAELRLANSRIEMNADGRESLNGTRVGRADNAPGAVFVRASQPVLIGNEFVNNNSAAITADINSLNYFEVNDHGRATGSLDAIDVVGNLGPLVENNSLTNNAINGMFVRGGALVTEGVWDDVNIVHVVTDTIEIPNRHIFGGLRVISDARGSLVVKFESGDEPAGIVVGGTLVSAADELRDIADRIGGALQLIGHPDFPVVLTTLADDTAGAGFTVDGRPQIDTNNDGIFFSDLDSGTLLLPTGPEVNNGILIDNDVAPDFPGFFEFQPTAGGDSLIARTTVQGATQVFALQDSLFEYSHWIDVGADGNAVRLSSTTITQQPTLVADDRVRSAGNFAGENGTVNWVMEQFFEDGRTDLVSELSFSSDSPLGEIRVINYYDPVIGTDAGDILFTEGTPGQNDFRLTILDGPEEIGFRQYGTFEAGPGLVNAAYEGWIADDFPDLITAPEFNLAFLPDGTVDAGVGLLNDPRFPQPNYGPGILTSALAWQVNDAATSSFVTTNLEVIAEVFGTQTLRLESGLWDGVTIREGADDRNVRAVAEQEPVRITVFDTNAIPDQAQFLGEIAPSEQAADENQRLGFIVDGAISSRDDVDVYSLIAESGTEVWLDIDRAGTHLDTVVELIDQNGVVLAASNDSILAESNPDAIFINTDRLDPDAARPLRLIRENVERQQLTISENIVESTGGSIFLNFDGFTASVNNLDVDVDEFLADPAGAVETALNGEPGFASLGPIEVRLLPRQDREVDGNGIITSQGDDFVLELVFDEAFFVGRQPPALVASTIQVIGATVTSSVRSVILQSQDQDDYTFSPKDAGMRVRLPGETGTENRYHIRVRSSNTRDPLDFATLTDPSRVRDGLSLGRYTLQVRLREADEVAGTQVNLADVRFATSGIQIIGQPFHSPLLGEDRETTAANDLLAQAQPLGYFGVASDTGATTPDTPAVETGPLSSDRLAKSVAGEIAGTADADWYQFEVAYDDLTRETGTASPLLLSTVFDLDYASNFARSDMAIYVFNAAGQLIFTGTDSNISDDQPGSITGTDSSDLSRGSAGTEDPFIGAVELTEGTYFLAISNQTQVPIALDQFFNPATNNPLVRLEPIDSVTNIVEERFGGTPVLFDDNSVVPYSLDDVVLYVNTINGLQVVNPFTGVNYGSVGNFGDEVRDIAFQANGELYGYAGFGNRTPSDTNWFYHQIDTGTATLSPPLSVGGGGLQTFHNQNAEANAIQILEQNSDDGIEVEGITIREFGGAEAGFLIGNRPLDRTGLGGLQYFQNLLYEFNERNGVVIGPTANRAVAVAGAGTSRREIGFLDTEAPLNAVTTQLGFSDATITDANGNRVAGLVDTDTFTIVSGLDIETFELDQGTTIFANGAVVDGNTFSIDGTLFEFNSGARLQIDQPGPVGNLDGGETVTITGSNGQVVTFEFLRLGQPNGDNIGIPTLDNTSQPLPLATILADFVSQVNANVLDARASLLNNEVVFGNIASITVGGAATGGLTLVGDPALNDPNAIEVPITETSSPVAIISAMDAAIRSVSIPVSSSGNQLALPLSSAIDVSGTPTLSQFGALGVSPGNIAIQLLPTDTADVIARRIVAAIDNSSLANVTTQIEGASIAINGGSVSVPTGSNFRAGGIPTGGQVTGVELVDGNLFAVTDTGGLFFVSSAELNSNGNRTIGRYVESATDLIGFEFEGLRAGPNSVDGGAYSDILFGITLQGDIVAFDTLGQLQPVFAGGRSVISTGIDGALGLDFSTLDFNLWHVTNSEFNQNGAAGHSGFTGSSIAFNYGLTAFTDNYESFAERPVQASSEIATITNPRVDGARVLNTYNFPGGAKGALNSNTFSLEGYAAEDQPVLYFSYFLDTDDGGQIDPLLIENSDALRVFVVTADGTEHLVASNSDRRTPGSTGDEFDDPVGDNIDVNIQQLFDNTGSWRQARVPLDPFAGESGLSLRVEFATSGALDAGDGFLNATAIKTIAASELLGGGTLVVNGEAFSVDFAPSVYVPSGPALAELYDDPAERATIELDGQIYVLNDGARTVNAGEISVELGADFASLSATEIAAIIADAMRLQPPPSLLVTDFDFSDPEDNPSVPSGRNDLLFEATQLPFEGQSTTITGDGLLGSNPALGPVTNLNDVDLQRVDLLEGTTITAQASFAANPAQSLGIRFFDAAGTPLPANTDPLTGIVTFTANEDGAVYIGFSAENNQSYDPRFADSGTNGQTGLYTASIDISFPLTIFNDGSLIEFVGASTLQTTPTSLFTVAGTSPVEGTSIRLSRGMTANEVALEVQRALANRLTDGDRTRVPVRGTEVILSNLTLNDAGPFLDTANSFSTSFGSTPVAGSRDNDREGVYLDDFIIGFAERGEQVSSSPVINQAFIPDTRFTFPEPNDPQSGLVTGSYQVEIRDASEYVRSEENVIFRQFDTNDRLNDSTSVVVRGADELLDGQSFAIFDGRSTLEFEFDLVEAGNGVTPGRVPIPFTAQLIEPGSEAIDPLTGDPIPGTGIVRPQTAAEVAESLVNAINQTNVQAVIGVTAIRATGVEADRIDLVGDVLIMDDSQVFEEIIRTRLRGDETAIATARV